jgi:hypothetical protein
VTSSTISWELLRRGALRQAGGRAELQLVAAGLAGPLLNCGWTVLRPFELARAYHSLLQCAVWLAAWYTLFTVLCCVLHWLRPRAGREDEDTRHLPLSAAHFYLRRCLELGQAPLLVLALSLPLWFIVLAFVQLPYGQQYVSYTYSWNADWTATSWPLRLLLATLALPGAVLVPLAAGITLSELGPPARQDAWRGMLRSAVLLLAVAGAYILLRHIEYDYFRMAYRQTRGYDWQGFVVPLALLLAGAFAVGLLSRRQRVATLGVAAVLGGALLLGAVLPGREAAAYRALLRSAHLADGRFAAGWALGHLSAPQNVRLLLERTSSNVLIAAAELKEPEYPHFPQDVPEEVLDQAQAHYAGAYKEYELHYAKLPRIPLWFGAAVYPSLLSLLVFGGLLVGNLRRDAPLREDD